LPTITWNRRTSATYPGSKVETFVHDAGGNLTRWTDRNGTVVQQAFDALGRMTGRTMTLASGVVGATFESFAYDAADRLISASNNAGSGHADTLTYSSFGRLLTESQDGRTVSYGYDIDGARVSRTAPSGRGSTTFATLSSG
jgi:YD repeat-containing protein